MNTTLSIAKQEREAKRALVYLRTNVLAKNICTKDNT